MTMWELTCWSVFVIGLLAYASSRHHMRTVKRDLDQMQKTLDKRQFSRVMFREHVKDHQKERL